MPIIKLFPLLFGAKKVLRLFGFYVLRNDRVCVFVIKPEFFLGVVEMVEVTEIMDRCRIEESDPTKIAAAIKNEANKFFKGNLFRDKVDSGF